LPSQSVSPSTSPDNQQRTSLAAAEASPGIGDRKAAVKPIEKKVPVDT
jgi:hypothetical protein